MYRTLLLATALTVGLAGAAVAQEVTIGLTMGTTGPGASLGVHYKNAFQLMPKTIGGYPVKFIMLEDKSDATEAAKNARQLITEDKVDALMGSVATPSTTQIAQIAAELKTPLMALSPVALPPEKLEWTFVVPQSTTLMMSAVVDHMKAKGVKTVGYIGFSELLGRHRSEVARSGGRTGWNQDRQQRALCTRRHQRHRPGAQGDGGRP